jgi:predicted amidohydrolase YtcJ
MFRHFWLCTSFVLGFGMSGCVPMTFNYERIDAPDVDYDVTPLPARYGLWASVARQTSSGRMPFGTMQSADIHAALRSYTSWAARQLFLEKQTGSLEPGKSADLAIWDRDPYSLPTGQLKDMVCEMTLFRGKLVYERTED